MGTIGRLGKRISLETFILLDRLGVHLLPKHYYTPIPDYAWLTKQKALWARRADFTGVEWNLDAQMAWLRAVCKPHVAEVAGFKAFNDAVRSSYGPGYGAVESQVLHCFIRSSPPRRIIEVGSGVSTACMLGAIEKNRSHHQAESQVLCIEPYPRPQLLALPGVSIQARPVQAVDLGCFEELESGDLLFIDSSHAVKTGSDVLYLYLEVIPRLQPGVFIHIHDIYFPYLYQRDVLRRFLFWQETALLLALLKGNARLRVCCSLSALHYDKQSEFAKVVPDYRPQRETGEGLADPDAEGHFPASIWLRTV
jgi:hypothetical protein